MPRYRDYQQNNDDQNKLAYAQVVDSKYWVKGGGKDNGKLME